MIKWLFEVSCAFELPVNCCRRTDVAPHFVSAVFLHWCEVAFAPHVFGDVSSIERRGAVGLAGN